MPVMILFQHGDTLTFSIIDRRLHKRDTTKDVLQKVTLIKDIRLENPHRAHVEILEDLALHNYDVSNFVELHNAWQKTLDTKELNKRFFQELANWYFWAVDNTNFPADEEKDADIRNATNVIRLITRLMFVWFLKEKGLVSDKLFNEKELKTILRFKDDSAYYKAILQNLFFATLNSEMNTRKFIAENSGGRNAQHFVHNVFRYQREFIKPEETIKELFEPIPFLNGGLFECLDKQTEVDGKDCRVRVDGFSDHPKNVLEIPDELFFGSERQIELNEIYGTKNKKYKVRGLINILNSYKFTITENTPIEEEIALDPELLGKVFENLLANFNPETKTTARKQTGSFYTPREIVNYMVDESLLAYLKAKLQTETQGFAGFVAFGENQPTMFGNEARVQQKFEMPVSDNRWHGKDESLETALRNLFSYTEGKHDFNETETEILIKAIDNCKILDPACGSGAFPMGILHRLVHLLGKLDKANEKWREWQRLKAIKDTEEAYKIGDHKEREDRLLEINDVFENNASDYGRKLFLIENCIYGVDIQPIAIQIAKLRFFISLIVDQKASDDTKNNLGIRPLPNLETKFVAANTLIGLETNGGLKPNGVTELEKQLKEVRAKHFGARTRRTKEKYRTEDKKIRSQIAELLRQGGINETSADLITDWNPYDQNASAKWFDAEWMFGIEKGFDIVIGNPPYVQIQKFDDAQKRIWENQKYKTYTRTGDIYCLFYERSNQILRDGGNLCFITSNKWMRADYGEKLRKYFITDTKPKTLIDFGMAMVFESATAYTNIFLLQKERRKNLADFFVCRIGNDYKLSIPLADYFAEKRIAAKNYNENSWIVPSKEKQIIKQKVERQGVALEKWNLQIYRGILTGFDEAFVIDGKTKNELISADAKNKEIIKPLLRGKDTKAWQPAFADLWLINTHNGIREKGIKPINAKRDFPAIYEHLAQYENKLKVRQDKGEHWTNLRNCAYLEELTKPKIIYPNMTKFLPFIYDETGYFPNAKCYSMTGEGLKYLTAFFNSRLFKFCFNDDFPELLGDTCELQKRCFEKIPVKKISESEQKPFEKIVDEIIEAKKQGATADTSKLECKIDKLVYQLYGLTDEEIRIVEGKA